MPYAPLSSALVLINTSSPAIGGTAVMSGSVEEVSKKLRNIPGKNIDLIHWLLGPTDMIVHVHATNFEELLQVLDGKILPLKGETHNRIASTETLIVTDSRARDRLSGLDERPTDLTAWVFANSNTSDTEKVFRLMDMYKEVFYMASVIGRYDVVMLVKAESLQELGKVIDKSLRAANFLTSTDTRIVLM